MQNEEPERAGQPHADAQSGLPNSRFLCSAASNVSTGPWGCPSSLSLQRDSAPTCRLSLWLGKRPRPPAACLPGDARVSQRLDGRIGACVSDNATEPCAPTEELIDAQMRRKSCC